MKTKEDKIKYQESKLVDFDIKTAETAQLIGRIDISTKQHYLNERKEERIILALKIDKSISKIQ